MSNMMFTNSDFYSIKWQDLIVAIVYIKVA